jgi:hypothetical protein
MKLRGAPMKIHLIFLSILLACLFYASSGWGTDFPGPDDFGYTGISIDDNLRNISGTGTPVPLFDDQVSGAIPIGFNLIFMEFPTQRSIYRLMGLFHLLLPLIVDVVLANPYHQTTA